MTVNYNPRIVTDGLVLSLDAANIKSYNAGISTTTWTDLSGNRNTGTLVNGPTFNSANSGSFVFDGVNDYVDCGNVNSNITNNLTLSLWVKFPIGYGQTTVAAGWNSIISKRAPGNQVNYGINYNPTATNLFQIYYNNFGGGVAVPLRSNFSEDIWTYICGTFAKNSTTTDLILYKNGSVLTSGNAAGNVTPPGGLSFRIGTYLFVGGGEYANISISQVSIYNRALSALEVLQNFNATRNRFGI